MFKYIRGLCLYGMSSLTDIVNLASQYMGHAYGGMYVWSRLRFKVDYDLEV